MNYKRKHPSNRKYRYLRRGWKGESKQKIRIQIARDSSEKIVEYFKDRD